MIAVICLVARTWGSHEQENTYSTFTWCFFNHIMYQVPYAISIISCCFCCCCCWLYIQYIYLVLINHNIYQVPYTISIMSCVVEIHTVHLPGANPSYHIPGTVYYINHIISYCCWFSYWLTNKVHPVVMGKKKKDVILRTTKRIAWYIYIYI